MTEFAALVSKWALVRTELYFTELDVKQRFPDVCQRKRQATLLGLVINKTLDRSTKEDGTHIYCLGELTIPI